MRARLEQSTHPGGGVRRLSLRVEPSFHFDAGQYLRILHPGGLAIPFSIASAPERLPDIDIDFRPLPGAPEAAALLDLVARTDELDVDGPFGDVRVVGPTARPLLLVAGGTGVGQCLAIVEHLTHHAQSHRVELVWSVSTGAHLYGLERLDAIRARNPWFEFLPCVDTKGRNAACAHLEARGVPEGAEVIVSGSPGFVYAVVDTIAARDPTVPIRADAFAYAPRGERR